MTLIEEMKARLEVVDGRLFWQAHEDKSQRAAGNANGKGDRVRVNGLEYRKDSVIAAIVGNDESLLERASTNNALAMELRKMLSQVNSRDDLLAVYRTIELLEESARD